jgi:spermidine synthase
MAGDDWVAETLYPDWGQRFRITRELARVRSPFQDIRIVETASHGRVMLLDGVLQISEADEFAYQEMIAHVPLIAHGAARRVLIIGAGDGGVLRRVLTHRTVEAATMVEIDAEVVRLSREHLPGIGGKAWDDPRARVLIADGIAHVAEAATGAYDVIIVDSTDPVGVGEVLFSDAFYADCARLVGPGGIVVNQCGVPFMQGEELRDTTLRRARHFADASAYLAAVPTYVGGFMTLGWSAQDAALRRHGVSTLAARAEAAGILGTTRYWSPGVHAAAFALPPYIASLLPGG